MSPGIMRRRPSPRLRPRHRHHLSQTNPLLHEAKIGGQPVGVPRRVNGAHALVTELVVSARTTNPPGYSHGR